MLGGLPTFFARSHLRAQFRVRLTPFCPQVTELFHRSAIVAQLKASASCVFVCVRVGFVWASWRPASCGLRGSRGFVWASLWWASLWSVGFIVVGFVVVGFVVVGCCYLVWWAASASCDGLLLLRVMCYYCFVDVGCCCFVSWARARMLAGVSQRQK